MDYSTIVARSLLQIGAVKIDLRYPFRWTSGIVAPIYTDNRLIWSDVPVRTLVVEALAHASARFLPFDVVVGVATAGIPPGAMLAQRLRKPFLYVRSKAKAHGTKSHIEGKAAPQSSALIVEDLISTGGSVRNAYEILRAAEIVPIGVLSIFNYLLTEGQNTLEQLQIPSFSLTNIDILLREAEKLSYLSAAEREELLHWLYSPKNRRKIP